MEKIMYNDPTAKSSQPRSTAAVPPTQANPVSNPGSKPSSKPLPATSVGAPEGKPIHAAPSASSTSSRVMTDQAEAARLLSQKQQAQRLQEFQLKAPQAKRVDLLGDFTQWTDQPVSMTKDATGTWRASVPLSAGTHHYRFLVDGEWCDDPACTEKALNPYGSYNAVRRVD